LNFICPLLLPRQIPIQGQLWGHLMIWFRQNKSFLSVATTLSSFLCYFSNYLFVCLT
jgi:hypothetical protein